MEWQSLATALAGVVAALLGIIWARVSGDLARVADRLAEVGQVVSLHSYRIDRLEADADAR